jgi:hypothetical protein
MDDRENYGQKITGNWISAVKPKDAELHVSNEALPKSAPQPSGYGGGGGGGSMSMMDDEIPFAPVTLI